MADSSTFGGVTRPPSASNVWVNHLAFAAALAYLFVASGVENLARYTSHYAEHVLFMSLLIYSLPIAAYDLAWRKQYRRNFRTLSLCHFSPGLLRIGMKLWGMTVTLALIAFAYWLFPLLGKGSYQQAANWLLSLWPYALGCIVVYVILADGWLREPEDEYWQMGRLCTGHWQGLSRRVLANYGRGWLIKAFFLPMMMGFLHNNITWLMNWELPQQFSPFEVTGHLFTLLYIADLMPVVIGYLISSKGLDNEIRSTDATVGGWMICLMCYPPFWMLFYDQFLPYNDDFTWQEWLPVDHWFSWIWAGLLALFLGLYASSSVAYGLRWSNLTYRGLISSGTYRFTKHPAYLFKNIFWWLLNVPFIVFGDVHLALQQVCFTLGVSGIYYLRCRTEERHLSQWPEYRQYAIYMNDHGITGLINRIFPFMRYRAPE